MITILLLNYPDSGDISVIPTDKITLDSLPDVVQAFISSGVWKGTEKTTKNAFDWWFDMSGSENDE